MTDKTHRSTVVDITAFRWTGQSPSQWPSWAKDDLRLRWENTNIQVDTAEGTMRANVGDWIILGTEGEIYPCKDSVFQRKYEPLCGHGNRESGPNRCTHPSHA